MRPALEVADVFHHHGEAFRQARAWANAWNVLAKDGRDPAAEERRKVEAEKRLPTIRAFAAEYLDRYAKSNTRSWREDERLLNHDVLPALDDLRIDSVPRRNIVAMLDAIQAREIETSPFVGIGAARERTRGRMLTDDEIRRLWGATVPGAEHSSRQDAWRYASCC